MQMSLDEYAARFPTVRRRCRWNMQDNGSPGMKTARRSGTAVIYGSPRSGRSSRLCPTGSPQNSAWTLDRCRSRMRFDYTGIISSAADTGDPTVIFRPEIRIMVHGPKGSREVLALVDTGSDDTVLSERVARDLGIPLVRGTGPAVRVFGGQEIDLSYADVELELIHPTEGCDGSRMFISWLEARTRRLKCSAIRVFSNILRQHSSAKSACSTWSRIRTCRGLRVPSDPRRIQPGQIQGGDNFAPSLALEFTMAGGPAPRPNVQELAGAGRQGTDRRDRNPRVGHGTDDGTLREERLDADYVIGRIGYLC